MNRIWAVAAITFKEGIRNRALYGIGLLALLMCGANLIISGMMMREVGKVAVDVGLASVGFAGLLLLLFVTINQLASDLDHKTLYMILARPVSRTGYLLGKYLGMVLLIAATMLLLALAMGVTLFLIEMGAQDYFERINWGLICLALLFNTLQLLLLCAISFFFASFTSTSFLTLILTIVTYAIGHGLPAVKKILQSADQIGIQVSELTVKLVEGAAWIFPNLALFDIRTQAAHGLLLGWQYIAGTLIYFIVYTAMVLLAAIIIFRRREFP
ncbi:MAG: ABC transporter permease [Deltaproteobacteria bacterium]|nr:ABC transporter permease [Deltaproteobacteria bacterium]